MDKATLRHDALAWLETLSPIAKAQIMADNLRQLNELPEWQGAQKIGITYSMPNELPTQMIIEAALKQGKEVYLPKCLPQRRLVFLPYRTNDVLIKSAFGVYEPQENQRGEDVTLDLLIVPGLRFATENGMRVGFGGGYYDCLLSQFTGSTVALSTAKLVVKQADWPVEIFDQAVDKILIGVEQNANNK